MAERLYRMGTKMRMQSFVMKLVTSERLSADGMVSGRMNGSMNKTSTRQARARRFLHRRTILPNYVFLLRNESSSRAVPVKNQIDLP